MTDFKKIFASLPAMYVAILPDYPLFTVVGVTDTYLQSVNLKLKDIIRKPLFEAFTSDPTLGESSKLFRSLIEVIKTKQPAQPEILQYPIVTNGISEVKYWSSQNIPILDIEGEIEYIIHAPLDITHLVQKGLRIL